jgi:predicted 3-demethylubiquinone-9 3-methyltransferase (glyoxalase superfamily)
MTVDFELAGQSFTALNGGPVFKFNEAISFQVNCDTQEEVDYFWTRLCEGGEESLRLACASVRFMVKHLADFTRTSQSADKIQVARP